MILRFRAFYFVIFLGTLILLSAITVVAHLIDTWTVSLSGAWFAIGSFCLFFFFFDTTESGPIAGRLLDASLFFAFCLLTILAVKAGSSASGVVLLFSACGTLAAMAVRRYGHTQAAYRVETILAVAAVVIATASILIFARRWYALPIAATEILAVSWVSKDLDTRDRIAVAVTAIIAWTMTAGYPYVSLPNFLLSATPSSGLALIAFAASFVLTNGVILSKKKRNPIVAPWVIVSAVIVFLVLGLRVDGTLNVWIPYHQSYFIGPAAMVRAGHWLLWDVPSQYGFGAVLAIAAFVGTTTFDKFYFLNDLMVAAEAAIFFLMACWGTRTAWGYIFAALLSVAVFYSSQAQYYPYGATLYPQEGFRLIWPMFCMFCAYLTYRLRDRPALRSFAVVCGYASWLIGCLWSAEVGVWATVPWGIWAIVEIYLTWSQEGVWRGITCALKTLLPFPALLGASWLGISEFYLQHLHHLPDFRAFFEFTLAYGASKQFEVPVNLLGGMWLILLSLAASGTAVVWLARSQGTRTLAGTLPAWFGLWGFTLYFVGESYETHVGSIIPIIAFLAMILWTISADAKPSIEWISIRVAFAPIFILLLTYDFGSLTQLEATHIPWPVRPDMYSQYLPPITGELATIERRAGIRSSDLVVYPSSPAWVKLSTGQILPLERSLDGTVRERLAWLPLIPAGMDNTMLTLSYKRQGTYIKRALEVGPGRGWLITYLKPADCATLWPHLRTLDPVSTAHYHAAFCSE